MQKVILFVFLIAFGFYLMYISDSEFEDGVSILSEKIVEMVKKDVDTNFISDNMKL